MRSLPMCAAWLILTGVSVALQSARTQPLEIIFLLFLTIYAISGFRRRGCRRPRERKIDQFPQEANPQFSLSCLVAHKRQLRRHRPDKFASQGAGSRAKEHRRAPAGEFPKPRGAAAIFSIRQKRGPFDQHKPLTRAFVRRGFPSPAKARILSRRVLAGARQGMSRLAELAPGISNSRDFLIARTIPSERKSRQGERHVSCHSRARRPCRRVAGVGL